jgi:hypothetical protein
MKRIIECALARKAPGTFGIVRLSSVYGGPLVAPWPNGNHLLRNFSILARQAIDEYNEKAAVPGGATAASTLPWHFWDPWDMLVPRRNEVGFLFDGIHYTGVGSRTMTIGLLQLVAACDKYCEPRLGRQARL